MRTTGPRTENPQASAVDREWSEAALLDRAERAESEANVVSRQLSRTSAVERETRAPVDATRPGPTPWRTVAVVGTIAVLPWLVLAGVAYLVYSLA